jgi:hypothetical protein
MYNSQQLSNINHHFQGVHTEYIDLITDYIDNSYNIPGISSKETSDYMQKYVSQFLCGTVYAGVLLPAIFFNINNYSYFLSKKFFSIVLNGSADIVSYISNGKDYTGYISKKKELSFIAKNTESKALYLDMDKGLSLDDIYKGSALGYLKMNIYKTKKRVIKNRFMNLFKNNHFSHSDIDNINNYPSFKKELMSNVV